MPVSISGDGTFAGLTSVETVNVLHPDAVTNNIVLADDGSVALDSIPASIQSAIDGAGGLVAVKHALFTGTQSVSTAPGANFAVTNLSITHAMADANNRLIMSVYLGAADSEGRGAVGIAVMDGASFINVGNAVGSRSRVTAGGIITAGSNTEVSGNPSFLLVHQPPDTTSRTYTVRAINVRSSTETVSINRNRNDSNSVGAPRTTSAFVIMEVKV